MRKLLIEFVPGLIGGLVAGYLGYLLVGFLISHTGFWVPIIPGAFAGLACGQSSMVPSRRRGIANGVLALAVAVYAQWQLFSPPFEFDGGLVDYTRQLYKLPWLTLVVLVLNALLGFWWGREDRIRLRTDKKRISDF